MNYLWKPLLLAPWAALLFAGSGFASKAEAAPPPPPSLQTLSIPVNQGSDDAEEKLPNGAVTTSSNTLDLTREGWWNVQLVGMRFKSLAIPPNANIVDARIQFTAADRSFDPTWLIVQGQATGNAPTFTTVRRNILLRTRTAASVLWSNVPAWTTVGAAGPDQATPNLKTIVQAIVNRGDWSAGNSMAFIIMGNGRRVAKSFEGNAPPVLHVTFATSQPVNAAPTATNVLITDPNGGSVNIGDVLTGTYTYNDAENDPQGASTFRWLRNGTPIAGATGVNYTTVAADTGTTLTFEVTPVAGSGTSPGAPATSPGVTVAPLANVQISGTVTYDRVPFGPAGSGLNYGGTIARPVRKATVLALDASNAVLATATTDNSGNYSVTVSPNTSVRIRVKAELLETGTPSWNVKVVDNTASNAQYVLDGALTSSGTANSTRNLHAPSGWGGSGYTSTRAAAPFAILDSMLQTTDKVLSADGNAVFPPLTVNWSVNNVPVSGDKTIGQIGTSHYTNGNLFILGNENTDTDEYDDHVMFHEWAHYYEDKFSRSDSIGGPHGAGDRLDMRVAFGEGWGNAFSGMVTDDPAYRDSSGAQQGSDFEINVESEAPLNPGWYSESSLQRILYDLYDATNEGPHDTVALGFTPIHSVMVNGEKHAQAFTSVFTFITALKAAHPGQAAGIDAAVGNESISSVADIFGTGETNDAGDANNVLPVYTLLTVSGGPVNLCSINDFGAYNKLSNQRFLKFSIGTAASYTVTVTRTSGPTSDPNFEVRRASDFSSVMNGFTGTVDSETATANLAAGDYVMSMTDAKNDVAPGQVTCFDVTLAP